MKTGKMIRILIGLYPVFVIGLFVWGWIHYGNLQSTREDFEQAAQTAETRAAKRAGVEDWSTEEDILKLRALVDEWHRKIDLKAADVPLLLNGTVREAGWDMTDYGFRGETVENGHSFVHGEITVRGTELHALLSALEKHPERFIKIPSIAITPSFREEEKAYELRFSIHVLVGKDG